MALISKLLISHFIISTLNGILDHCRQFISVQGLKNIGRLLKTERKTPLEKVSDKTGPNYYDSDFLHYQFSYSNSL